MKKFYEAAGNRLVFMSEAATPDFWDRQWEDEKLKDHVLSGARERFVYPTTKKYLSTGSKILEGGCGKGRFVYSLAHRGYQAYGIDYAERIIERLRSLFPDLKYEVGDVRKIPYADNFFDGYWSLGVIEHFPNGYTPIAKEMARILRPGGYLFLTFPYMSPLRRLKAHLHFYPSFKKERFKESDFYQFALYAPLVIKEFEKLGFKLVQKKPYDAFKGLKDEAGALKPLLQKIYDHPSLISKIFDYGISTFFAPVSSHAVLLVLKKGN